MNKKGKLSELILYAIRSGHVTLIARVRNEKEKLLVNRELGSSMVEEKEQRTSDRPTL